MTDKKTCGECPWTDRQFSLNSQDGRYVFCDLNEIPWASNLPECSYRKSFRILRDEIRRLRVVEEEFERFLNLPEAYACYHTNKKYIEKGCTYKERGGK